MCGLFPKLAGALHSAVWQRLLAQPKGLMAMAIAATPTNHFLFYQEATQYWVKAVVGLPYYAKNKKVTAPAHGRYLYFASKSAALAAHALLNSSLFYTYFIAYGDCFHLSDTLARSVPVPASVFEDAALQDLSRRLSRDLEKNATRTAIDTKDGDRIEYAAFNVSESKPILDEIDRVLAKHYGFTDEELDFIINYDIRYRMGRDGGEEEE
jgi:hypothetical protein